MTAHDLAKEWWRSEMAIENADIGLLGMPKYSIDKCYELAIKYEKRIKKIVDKA
jgi:hypothetical protein